MMQRRRKKCGLVGIPRSCQRSRSKQPHMQRGRQQRGQKPQQLFAFCQSWPCCCGSSPRCGALHQPRFPVPFPAQQLMPVPVPWFPQFCFCEYKNHFSHFAFNNRRIIELHHCFHRKTCRENVSYVGRAAPYLSHIYICIHPCYRGRRGYPADFNQTRWDLCKAISQVHRCPLRGHPMACNSRHSPHRRQRLLSFELHLAIFAGGSLLSFFTARVPQHHCPSFASCPPRIMHGAQHLATDSLLCLAAFALLGRRQLTQPLDPSTGTTRRPRRHRSVPLSLTGSTASATMGPHSGRSCPNRAEQVLAAGCNQHWLNDW